jgi:hypothetical protein
MRSFYTAEAKIRLMKSPVALTYPMPRQQFNCPTPNRIGIKCWIRETSNGGWMGVVPKIDYRKMPAHLN